MSISYQFGDVDAHGAMIRSQAASLEAEHQSIVRDVLAAGDFWGGSGSVACQEFITQLGRNFQVIYEQANSHGQKVQTAGNNMSSHRLRRRRQLGLTLTPSKGSKRTGHRAARCVFFRRRTRAYPATATQAPRTVVETKLAALAR